MANRSVVARHETFKRAAAIWCDMERGLYDWGEKPVPRHRDGRYRVLRDRIIADLGYAKSYNVHAKRLIWENPEFLKLLALENARRDRGIALAIAETLPESGQGPLARLDERLYELAVRDLEEDPEALATKDKISLYLQTHRLRMELEGKTESVKQQGIDHVLDKLAAGNQVTNAMIESALTLVAEYRQMQDRKLKTAGYVVDATAEEE